MGKACNPMAVILECGDSSPLSRGDLSPSNCGRRCCAGGRSRLAPAPARPRGWTRTGLRRRQVACAKAVTSHRTPKRRGPEFFHSLRRLWASGVRMGTANSRPQGLPDGGSEGFPFSSVFIRVYPWFKNSSGGVRFSSPVCGGRRGTRSRGRARRSRRRRGSRGSTRSRRWASSYER